MLVSEKRQHNVSEKQQLASKKQCRGFEDEWGFLERDVLELIVKILENQEKEATFYPSLRLVNKHWSSVLNFGIKRTEIGMCSDISIVLQKFPNLTSVKISKTFSTAGNNSRAKQNGNENEYANTVQNNAEHHQKVEFKRAVDLVCKIPKLEEVILPTNDASHGLQVFMMEQLKRISKLKFFTLDGIRQLDLYYAWYTALSKLKLEKVTFHNVKVGFTRNPFFDFKYSATLFQGFHRKHDPFFIYQK